MHSERSAAIFFLRNLKLERQSGRGASSSQKTILFVDMPGVRADVLAAFRDDADTSIHSISFKPFIGLASVLLHPALDDNNYVSRDPEVEQTKLKYRAFLTGMFRHALQTVPIDVVISGNFSYYAERELAAALAPLNVPHVILMKENLKTPGRQRYFEELYRERRGPFLGDRILSYNEIEKSVQVRAGVASPDRVKVVGMPRLDDIHRWREQNVGLRPERKLILVFWFGKKTGLPVRLRKERANIPGDQERLPEFDHLSWAMLQRQVAEAISEVAKRRPDILIRIKAKNSRNDAAALLGGPAMPSNIEITTTGRILDLVSEASVVTGFNSTTIFEAIAAGRPVVVPCFAEAVLDNYRPFVVDCGRAVTNAGDKFDYMARLIELADANSPIPADLAPDAREALQMWTGNPDGQAGWRTRQALSDLLERRASRAIIGKSSLAESDQTVTR
jgi:hypothetical protein